MSVWKFLEVTVYHVSYLNKCSIWPHFAVPRTQGDDTSWQSLVLDSNCRWRSLTKTSTNGAVALNAWS